MRSARLDPRGFQDIVNQAKELIPQYCPAWTDHNVSDPGITLIELFAWMTDALLYRINQVPDRVHMQLLDLIGVQQAPPVPARVALTFRLSAPQESPVTIPASTEAATPADKARAIVFSTLEDAIVPGGNLVASGAGKGTQSANEETHEEYSQLAAEGGSGGVAVFQAPEPQPGDFFYLVFDGDLSGFVLDLGIRLPSVGRDRELVMEGHGIDPSRPPLKWQMGLVAEGQVFPTEWLDCPEWEDGTRGLNESGNVIVVLPMTARAAPHRTFVRCLVTRREYNGSPVIQSLSARAIGITVPAEHSSRLSRERLGFSDGRRNQQFALKFPPVIDRQEGETLIVTGDNGIEELWHEVTDFADSEPLDPHFALDSATGALRFGPVVRTAEGEERVFGRIPPPRSELAFTTYRTGGGTVGNVGAKTITFLRSSVPYVASVKNYEPAVGGRDAESLDEMKIRALRILRQRDTAVTASDFEHLAVQSSRGRIARAYCRPPTEEEAGGAAGRTIVVIVPDDETAGDPPLADESMIDEVERYIDERRMVGTVFKVVSVEWQRIEVHVTLSLPAGARRESVQRTLEATIRRYLDPYTGGREGLGWPFERPLRASDLLAVLSQAPEAEFLQELTVSPLEGSNDGLEIALSPRELFWLDNITFDYTSS